MLGGQGKGIEQNGAFPDGRCRSGRSAVELACHGAQESASHSEIFHGTYRVGASLQPCRRRRELRWWRP